MTELRQAARIVLNAWDDPMGMKDLCVALDALRTALAQEDALHELTRLGQEIDQQTLVRML